MSDARICSHLCRHTKQANNLSPYLIAEPEIGWRGALLVRHGLLGHPGLCSHINELKWASGWRRIWRGHWFSVLLGLQEWHHVSQGSGALRQVRTLISLGPFSLREKSTHDSTMGSPKFPIPESPLGPGLQGLMSSCDSLFSRGSCLDHCWCCWVSPSNMQGSILGLRISEGFTVLCGKVDMEMQHSFPKDPLLWWEGRWYLVAHRVNMEGNWQFAKGFQQRPC